MPRPASDKTTEPRRTLFFRDPQIANSLVAASRAGIIRGRGNLSEVVSDLSIRKLKTIREACERRNIKLPDEVYSDLP